MAPRDVGASRSSQCDWRDSRSPPFSVCAHRDPLYSLSFTLPAPSLSRHSAHPSSPPSSACMLPSLSLLRSISDSSVSISRLFFPIVLFVSIYHPLRYIPFSFIPWGSPCPSHSFALFLPHSPFLLGLLSIPISFSLSHPRFSLVARISFCPAATLQTLAKLVTWTLARPIVRRVTSSACALSHGSRKKSRA